MVFNQTRISHSKKFKSAVALATLVAFFNFQPVQSSLESEFTAGLKDYQSRNYRQALVHFEAALAQGNGSAECYLYIANSQTALGNTSEAIKRFREVERIFKGLPAETTAKTALRRLDPLNKFVDKTAKAASNPSATRDKYIEQGLLLLKQRNFADARKCFEYRLSKVPNDEEALYYKALCHHYEGNRTKAVEGYSYLATNMRDTEKGKLALTHLEKLSPADWKKVASSSSNAPSDYISDSGKYKDKRIVLSDKEYKKEYAAIPKQTEIALTHAVSAGENALPASINGQPFLMRVRAREWETLISLQDAKHARLVVPSGNPNSFETNEFSEKSIPVWKSACEIAVGGIKRKVPVAITSDTIGVPRLGRAFFEDLKVDGMLHKVTFSKKSDMLDLGKKAQIVAEKGDYEILPEAAEIRFRTGDHNHMIIDAHINGKPMQCMFDTGANEFFSVDQLSRCGIHVPTDKPPDGAATGWAGKGIPVWKVTVPIKVGTITRNLEVRAAQDGVSMPLIGQGFIRDFQYSIDRSGGRMTLFKKTSTVAKAQSTEKHSLYDVPCKVENDREYVSVTINGHRIGPILVDTGASTSIFSKGQASAAGIVVPANAAYYTIGGVGGQLEVRQVFVDLSLGPVLKQDFPIYVGGNGMSAIGQDFMSGWRFTVDRDREQLRFFH
ncbi:MAG: retroviral-like aspartic protease family protein [Candidatus Melainabacteria bacterium]|nr:retroviral-like aspartic protease family protein [Candidatus Melainabacteria bacterium]